jgi:hypothetical protein
MFEFACDSGHITEKFIDETVKQVECSVCGEVANRIMSSVRCSLEGITGDFPGAYAKWNKVHREANRVAKKRNE